WLRWRARWWRDSRTASTTSLQHDVELDRPTLTVQLDVDLVTRILAFQSQHDVARRVDDLALDPHNDVAQDDLAIGCALRSSQARLGRPASRIDLEHERPLLPQTRHDPVGGQVHPQ